MTTWQRWKRDLSWEWRKMNGKGWLFRFSKVLLVLGILENVYELITGAGVAGHMMRRQIENNGSLGVGLWPAMVFCLFVVVPFVLVGVTEPKIDPVLLRRSRVSATQVMASIALALTLLSASSYWKATHGPDTTAAPIAVDVSTTRHDFSDGMARLSGVAQERYGLEFVEVSSLGRGATRTTTSEIKSIFPITTPLWNPREPVRFLLASDLSHVPVGRPLPEGVLLKDSLPWYLSSALERRGVVLANPYYVLHTKVYLSTRGEWDAIAAISGFFAVLAWIGVWLVRSPDLVK